MKCKYRLSYFVKNKKIEGILTNSAMHFKIYLIRKNIQLSTITRKEKLLGTIILSKPLFKRFLDALRSRTGKTIMFKKFRMIVNPDRIWIRLSTRQLLIPFNTVYTLFNAFSKVVY